MASNHIVGGHSVYDVAHLQDHLVWIQNLIENLPRTIDITVGDKSANVDGGHAASRPKSSAAAASIARRVLPRGAFAQFEWTCGDQHPVPEDWKFPQSTCLAMWELWFHGDLSSQLCPFRHLLGADLTDPNSKRSMYVARRVIKVLIDLAISKGVAANEDALADHSDLRSVYHQCFETMSQHPTLLSKPLDVDKWSTCSYMTVYDALQKGRRTNLHELTFTWADGTLHLTPEGYRLPATNCSAMWQMWFRGDAAAGIGPFRYLKESDVDNRQDLYRARKAMNMLVEVAIEQGVVTSQDDLMALSDEELETAFELAFDDYTLQTHGDDKGPTPQDMSVRRLYESLQKRKRLVDDGGGSSVFL
ncbi:hypothetical protein DYB37_012368 [Aphanomyces astaci]|uniref:Uncharacterized protein n=1 Tax=Aphanomyces astaci TaxID=112090 RepID=A0A3R6WU41_APHAT|nr:hypothetical protein DYB35_006789 [Aphanomyces astaci]RHZ12366.1 hypothetical protein DYB37_012368 [Aphanomyces astaci]